MFIRRRRRGKLGINPASLTFERIRREVNAAAALAREEAVPVQLNAGLPELAQRLQQSRVFQVITIRQRGNGDVVAVLFRMTFKESAECLSWSNFDEDVLRFGEQS